MERQCDMQTGKCRESKRAVESKEIILRHSKDFWGHLPDPEVIKLTGLSRNTYYKYKRELKLQQVSEENNECTI